MAFNDAVARLTRARWETENHKHCDVWKTCRDADLVFSTDVHVDRVATANNVPGRVNVYIGDMYSAMNARFLSENEIRVVVNMMGPPDTVDEYNKFYGPGCNWTQDKQACEKDFMTTKKRTRRKLGQSDYQNSVEEKVHAGAACVLQAIKRGLRGGNERRCTMECDRATLPLCHSESVGTRGSSLSFHRL